MAKRLKSLRIANFRVFRKFEVARLGTVNLFVGKNSTGKTCVLEALRVLAGGGERNLLSELVRERHEQHSWLVDSRTEHEDLSVRELLADPLRNLFHGYHFPEDFGEAMEIGSVDGRDRISLELRALRRTQEDDGSRVEKLLDARSISEVPEDASVVLFRKLRVGDSRRERVLPMTLGRRSYVRRGVPKVNPDGLSGGCCFVAASGWQDADVEAQWSRISIRPSMKKRVLDAIQIIDPEVQDLVMVPTSNGRGVRDFGFEPVAVYGDERRMPLRGLGEGVSRMFQVVLAAVSAVSTEAKFVLLDEIENGLHWSVQSGMWSLVVEMAREFGLQVFATTHSWDCVRAFRDVVATTGVDAALVRLGRSVRKSQSGKIVAKIYDGVSLERATRAGLEVR